MDPKSEKPLRLFVNPFSLWSELALKTGEAMLASVHAAALGANGPKVGVIPTPDAPPAKVEAPKAQAPKLQPKPARHASKAVRFKASKAKLRSKINGARRAAKR